MSLTIQGFLDSDEVLSPVFEKGLALINKKEMDDESLQQFLQYVTAYFLLMTNLPYDKSEVGCNFEYTFNEFLEKKGKEIMLKQKSIDTMWFIPLYWIFTTESRYNIFETRIQELLDSDPIILGLIEMDKRVEIILLKRLIIYQLQKRIDILEFLINPINPFFFEEKESNGFNEVLRMNEKNLELIIKIYQEKVVIVLEELNLVSEKDNPYFMFEEYLAWTFLWNEEFHIKSFCHPFTPLPDLGIIPNYIFQTYQNERKISTLKI